MAYDDGFGKPQMQFALPPFRGWVKKLVIINVAIFVVQFIVDGVSPAVSMGMTKWLGLDPGTWWGGFPALWQLVSYGFLHSIESLGHIFGNMLMLFFFGEMVQSAVGDRRFIAHYLIAIALGGVAHLALAPLMGWNVPVIGASGAVSAMIVAAAVMRPQATVFLLFIPIQMKWLAIASVGMDVFGFLNEVKGKPEHVAHSVHLAGAAYGFLAVRRRWIWKDPLAIIERKRAVAVMERQIGDDARMDQIMAKISREGIGSLTRSERAFMKRQSERKRQG